MSSEKTHDIAPSAKVRREMFGDDDGNKLGGRNIAPSVKVCRQLLPVNHEEVAATLDTEFRKHIAEKTKQWNFDFEKDEPINSNDGFHWVEFQEYGKENEQGTGSSWRAVLGNDEDDDDVFTTVTDIACDKQAVKPRNRLLGTSEDDRDFNLEGRTFSPIIRPQNVRKVPLKTPHTT